MSFAPFQNIHNRDAGSPSVHLFSSVTNEYSALIISSSLQLGGRDVVFAAVYGQFDEALIGGSANVIAPNSFPDPTKQIVYYKGDDQGKAFFSTPQGPPECEAFTHCIYVFDVQNNVVNIQGLNGIAYTISLDDATKLTMEDLPSVDKWCKSKTLISAARTTTSTTAANWILGIIIGIIVLLVLIYFFSLSPVKKARRKEVYESPYRDASPLMNYHTPTKLNRKHDEVVLRLTHKSPKYNAWND